MSTLNFRILDIKKDHSTCIKNKSNIHGPQKNMSIKYDLFEKIKVQISHSERYAGRQESRRQQRGLRDDVQKR